MSQVITFERFKPVARFDDIPWTEARVEEAAAAGGSWSQIDVITLDPVDADPANPASRNLTTELASDTAGLWYRIIFADATGDTSLPTEPIQNVAPAVSVRDLCTLADVTSYVPAYVSNDTTDAKLAQLISSESLLIIEESGRELVAATTGTQTREFQVTAKELRYRIMEIGDLASTDSLTVTLLNRDGTTDLVFAASVFVPLYDGKRQPTRDWEPITSLSFPAQSDRNLTFWWADADQTTRVEQGQIVQVEGVWGFPQIPGFIREACAKRVILRYLSDVAISGTDFAQAVGESGLNLAAMFNSAEDAVKAITCDSGERAGSGVLG